MRTRLAGLICGALLLGAGPALANGRFPAAGQVLVDPADGQHLVLRATFGLLRSRDRGATAGWICETAVGYAGQEDPMMALGSEGALLAGMVEGLAVSRDDGCRWSLAGGPLAGLSVIDLSVRSTDLHEVVVLATQLSGGGPAGPRVFRSSDDAQSFTELAAPLPADFLALTLDAAPSKPTTLYVSGRFGAPDYQAAILRTVDGGQSWTRLDLAGVLDRLPYLAAIAPDDPATVYVRVDDQPGDRLIVTHDGGKQWTELLVAKGDLLAFALSPDGTELVAGGDQDGLLHTGTAMPALTPVQGIAARCATWAKEGLFVCADQLLDGYALGFSKDGGKTLTSTMQLDAACAPLACPAGSSVAAHCPAEWPPVAMKLDVQSCVPDAGPTSSAASSSGGPSSGGCGCELGGPRSAPALGLAALLLGLLRASRAGRARRAGWRAGPGCRPRSR